MRFRALSIPGAWEITPRQHTDSRGLFLEAFSEPAFIEAIGHPLALAQANTSVSGAGVIRGIHFADLPPSQAKYVMCPAGAVLDVVVDIRTGSPTFGRWEAVLLDDVDRRAIYVSEGLGHAFCSLADGSVVTYLCSATYAPQREHGISPFCQTLAIAWPTTGRDGAPLDLVVSEKDTTAPGLDEAREAGLLPDWEQVRAFTAALPSLSTGSRGTAAETP